MKIRTDQRTPKKRFDGRVQTFPLSRAKTYLGRLLAKVMEGETVYITRGTQRFVLQKVHEIEPIPMRPPGYFANCYTSEEIALDNQVSKASVVRAPKDLE
jgi:hypothetical protein